MTGTDSTASPCHECGGPKPRGQGRKLCDHCRPLATSRQRARAQVRRRAYYGENREKILAQNRAWAEANPAAAAAARKRHYARDVASGDRLARNLARYGLTCDDYEAMLEAQGGVCAICGGTDQRRRLNVDHDHATGEVRGLLCSGCNGARLGRLGDSIERAETRARYYEERAAHLRRAIEYLTHPPARAVIGEAQR